MRRSHYAATRPVRPPEPDPAPRRPAAPRAVDAARPVDPARPTARAAARPAPASAAAALVVAALSAGLLSACDGSDPAGSRLGIDRGEFIEVVVALRDAKFDLEQQDSVPEGRFEELRDSVLAAHGVESAELYAFVSAHPDLEYQEALWDSINRRLKRPLMAPAGTDPVLPDTTAGRRQVPRPGDAVRLEPDRIRR